ncbi:substrate-binding domain-containing protein [Paracoccus shanxieyensis]|uniref:Phosphonate ABC transporter substrate-binding protein n=1 Tax=Paracoccus shanxieyensis TaxID=2675752 RepID=A0A6L6IYP4_9RHOB|nr:substrate-binding domain-containing protein [Paracoccus shanxieyensis]MTH65353.1 phosphonate ABC transporter substrate-binding protein [Paracoccus shanxieyensis]MTH88498.1 phosphonate ABC transporter substrate-binding protein [Paracoccus shanxieyensis]
MKSAKLAVSVLAIIAASATVASARDQIQVSGSSTVLPYSTIVAEAFGENTDFPTPVVESGGSSAGLKKFCEGVGENTIDIANASRPIKESEIEACKAAGVTDIMEVRIGYDGIVFASDISGNDFQFTASDWFNALAAQVVVDGKVVANPYTKWNQIRADLPDQDILAFVPGTKHGTREVFEEKVIHAGCKDSGAEEAFKAAMSEDDADGACMALRTDGKSVDIDGDYTETLARIQSAKHGIGVFGLSFYENNTDKLKVGTFAGVTPSTESIASGEYPVSRPLFFYVKKAHIGEIQGLKEFVEFFVSDEIAGPDGPLAAYGLVSDPQLADVQKAVADETVMAAN